MTDSTSIYQRPAELLQNLIRFNTTNPPGNEAECIAYVDGLLQEAGIETTILGRNENRLNLIARLKGRGDAPPLMMYGHVDVVTTANQKWTYPPFGAEIHDGYIWGRGALDMKGAVAMFIAAFLRAKIEGADLPGDVILMVLADEEDLGTYGASYMVDEHPELFEGVRYALGEFGGFTLSIGGERFYPIMISEKQACWMTATVHGPGGHGSMPVRGGAMAQLGDLLSTLDKRRAPVQVTPAARMMIEGLAEHLPGAQGFALKQVLKPALTDALIDRLGAQGRIFYPLLHHTVSPTVITSSSDKVNVIPSEVTVQLDGRLLPGYQPDDLIRELRADISPDVDIEITSYDPGPPEPDMTLFDTLAGILKESDPTGHPIPLLLSGVTDGRFFAKLGIQTYGFTPMQLPADFAFTDVIHAADERIPVEAVGFGTDAIYQALLRNHG